jgi:negative regulator of flagellin synthesis FlgM
VTSIHNGLEASLGLTSGSADKTQAAQAKTADQAPQVPTSAATGQPGEVAITSTAQLMASLEQQLAGTPDIDQSRVDSISQALSNGSYQVDARRVADGLQAAQKFDAQASAGPASGTQSNTVKAFTTTALLGSDQD